ncbi:calcium calmodulin-dependent protein kinase [Grosmannia clavigera kw1407]|uniref:Calcium calmodulin-dependent protein kinase n=1 Tax=Grosmannia clavigera (strain kw1407 / UAMH 11150) TaxID=655863 RepID=F0XH16_GROCL|nr:calcium calmodulin-dependent protein kinase [Grosmannia clavigera kw1407]EFX03156.1 calcium calmodulin-dependent protein kinase [Grosmannia clavigera kw1407]
MQSSAVALSVVGDGHLSLSGSTMMAQTAGDPASRPEAHPVLSPSPTITAGLRDGSIAHLSPPNAPVYHSPIRQHRRTPSHHREVKETLNAVSEFADDEEDGLAHHKINQYTIISLLGRGSYGSVHLATDQYGQEFAIKEFSKALLRRRARSNILRRGPVGRRPGMPFNSAARFDGETKAEAMDALYLIREEIAVMKKLNHPNLVQLIEVLDDPDQDSLYMVLEVCKKGVIMSVDLGKPARPYDAEACRCWFRDLMLGIEYLHAQNIVHRDIKPDNLLITDDDVLKIGDFGVSQIFEKMGEMRTSKTAGSPAFLPPELCSLHGEVSGTACDIWSMGITLYCLRYGRLPFNHASIVDIYNAITNDEAKLPEDEDPDFVDLMQRILEKDPGKRIVMSELREHPWVTKRGKDPLLSAEENCAEPIEPPNALEVNHAFTRNISHLLCVMKAIRKFKGLLSTRSQEIDVGLLLSVGNNTGFPVGNTPIFEPTPEATEMHSEIARLVQEMRENKRKAGLQMQKIRNGIPRDTTIAVSSNHLREQSTDSADLKQGPMPLLGIGTGDVDDFTTEGRHAADNCVSESPTNADFDIQDRAFQSELNRTRSQHARPSVYPKNGPEHKEDEPMAPGRLDGRAGVYSVSPGGFADLPGDAKNIALADVVACAMEESRS